MKAIEQRLPQDFDKSFVVFRETGKCFPCPWHFHPEYELVLILRSDGRRMVGDHIGYFEEEDLVFMGAGLPHVWMNDQRFFDGLSGYDADAIVIHFKESFLGDKFLSIPEMENFKNFLRLSTRGMAFHGKTRKRINALMKEMLTMSGLMRLSALFEIFDILSNSTEYTLLASPGYVQKIELKSTDRFAKVNEYIMRNFDKEITLPEVASIANMAVTTFCNFFKDHYRVTFVEYLNTVRIGFACKLLADDDQNIVEIAYESGFKNLANFNRQFKRFKNMTPSEYRRAISNNSEITPGVKKYAVMG